MATKISGSALIGIVLVSLALVPACSDGTGSGEVIAAKCGSGGPLTGPGGDATGPYMERTLVMDTGEERSYLLRLPADYDPTQRADVVFTFHGAGSSMLQQLAYSDFMALADRDQVILVSPDANKIYDYSGNPLGDYWSSAWEANLRERDFDVDFIRQLVNGVQDEYCTGDFFAAGMSAGGDISSAFQCLQDSPFKAHAPVTYAYYNSDECRDAPPRPMIYFHGTADFIVPFDGQGAPWFDPPVPELMQNWAAHNGCNPVASEDAISPEVTRYSYNECTAAVTWYKVTGGGHTWPGGVPFPVLGLTTEDVDASELIWAWFFGTSPSS